MEELGFLELRSIGKHKVFFCGYGVVGKGWGFIYSVESLSENTPYSIGKNGQLSISYLKKLDGNWYRFGAG